ncbi:MAG: hypothetical protein WBQ44_02880 [Rhodococcus sp. (in: high G+C Gram-positive bacteria)]
MSTILVIGAGGGTAATTTAVGLGDACARDGRTAVVADATVGGGDLAERAGDRGIPVVDRPATETAEPDYERLDWYLRHRTDVVLYDLGHRALGRERARPLRSEPSASIVLTVCARPDAVARTRSALRTISFDIGERALRRTQVVLSHLVPGSKGFDFAELEDAVFGRVAGVHEIAFDPHLGDGDTIAAAQLAPSTAAVYRRILDTRIHRASGTLSSGTMSA